LLARRIEGAESRELVAMIEAEVARLTALLDRLLTPQPAREPARLNIHGVLERVVQLAAHDAGWAVRLLRDYDPSLPEIEGDADALVQAVWNLVRNAFEAGALAVTLSTRVEYDAALPEGRAPALRLDVVDDGRGVPEALAEHLFLPLVSGRADGSGLGLALAQQVARQHRGLLGFRSRPGHTVFSVRLPLPKDPQDATGAQDARPGTGDAP
jgi:two-component system nitrogen regulation sensor histidine kinase GlnL